MSGSVPVCRRHSTTLTEGMCSCFPGDCAREKSRVTSQAERDYLQALRRMYGHVPFWDELVDIAEAAEWRYGNNPSEYHQGNQKLDSALGRLRDRVELTA